MVRPFGWVDIVLHRRVLCGHSKSIPAHGVKDVHPTQSLEARDHVAHSVVSYVAHMNSAGRVWKHFKYIVFWTRIIVQCDKDLVSFPNLLPFGLHFTRVVPVRKHGGIRHFRKVESPVAMSIILQIGQRLQNKSFPFNSLRIKLEPDET